MGQEHLRRKIADARGRAAHERLHEAGRGRGVRLAVDEKRPRGRGAEDRDGAGQPFLEHQDLAVARPRQLGEGPAIEAAIAIGIAEHAARQHLRRQGGRGDDQVDQEGDDRHGEKKMQPPARHGPRQREAGQAEHGARGHTQEEGLTAAPARHKHEAGHDRSENGAERVPGVRPADHPRRAGSGRPEPADGDREHRPEAERRQDHQSAGERELHAEETPRRRPQAIVRHDVEKRQLPQKEQAGVRRQRHVHLAESRHRQRVGLVLHEARAQPGADRQPRQKGR